MKEVPFARYITADGLSTPTAPMCHLLIRLIHWLWLFNQSSLSRNSLPNNGPSKYFVTGFFLYFFHIYLVLFWSQQWYILHNILKMQLKIVIQLSHFPGFTLFLHYFTLSCVCSKLQQSKVGTNLPSVQSILSTFKCRTDLGEKAMEIDLCL